MLEMVWHVAGVTRGQLFRLSLKKKKFMINLKAESQSGETCYLSG